eukprot:SAG22_NODE_2015_length_3137_cov_7.334101_3_plen_68_part_00
MGPHRFRFRIEGLYDCRRAKGLYAAIDGPCGVGTGARTHRAFDCCIETLGTEVSQQPSVLNGVESLP